MINWNVYILECITMVLVFTAMIIIPLCKIWDWVLFANIKRIRLPGTEHMDKEYHQKKYHVIRSVMGMGFGLIPCLLCGVIFI